MKLYLFPALCDEPVVGALLALREGRADQRLYNGLFPFVCRWAYTEETAREYAVRTLLRNPPPYWRGDVMQPYLEKDAAELYRLFYEADWDALCGEAGLLPLPVRGGGDAPGEKVYRDTIARLVRAESPESLYRQLCDFFTAYCGEDEAMYRAFHWDGGLHGILSPDPVSFESLRGLAYQKGVLIENTSAFVGGKPANDVLLVGGGGTGKSSCIKAAVNRFASRGLKLVEMENRDLEQLPALLKQLAELRRKYVVFIDDLSFEDTDKRYLALKSALDGSMAARPANVLIYATSNRRHLVRETWKERNIDEDIHLNDTVNEKLSLSARFGIRLFFPFLSQREYLDIVELYLQAGGAGLDEQTGREAIAWATENNGCSGRSARQFAKYYLAKVGAGTG